MIDKTIKEEKIKNIFCNYISSKNFITPNIITYKKYNNFIVRISQSEKSHDKFFNSHLFGITVIEYHKEINSYNRRFDLDCNVNTKKELITKIKEIIKLSYVI